MGEDEARGFQPIGSLIQPIVRSPQNLRSTLDRSLTNSATTGTPSPAAKLPASIGTRHSAMPVASTPRDITAAMASNDPERTDSLLLASLPQSVAHSLMPTMTTWSDPEYGFSYEVTGYSLADPSPPPADLEAARLIAAPAMAPAPRKAIAAELARLAALTKSRADAQDDQTLRFAAFGEELAEFPQDVIGAALRKIARRQTFFPSLAEVRDQCQREFRHRKLLVASFNQ
jgi:hypothetical protein